jgi:serine/threonine-protein kinase SRPK3
MEEVETASEFSSPDLKASAVPINAAPEFVIQDIENSIQKKKKKKGRKKKKANDELTQPTSPEQTEPDNLVHVLTSIDNKGEESAKSKSNVHGDEAEEFKKEIEVLRTKSSKKKRKGKAKKALAASAPKLVQVDNFPLKRIEITDDFWKAYDSDATSSGSDAESLNEYTKGGYHPVHVGETFKNRYRILKKLGWGAFSTVWFSHDMQQNKFVAIKVQKSGDSYYSAAEDEIEILEVIADKWTTDDWKESIKEYSEVSNINSCHCMHMMDHFEFEGPNGKHIGMVFEVMGANLLKIMKLYEWEGIPVPIVRVLAKQLLIGLDYLHRLCNVIHTDIKPENAILCPTEQQLIDHYESVPEHFRPNIKGKLQTSMFFSKEQNKINKRKKKNQKKKKTNKDDTDNKENNKAQENKDGEDEKPEGPINEDVQVKICDFGNGCWTDHHFTSTIQTRQYRSPEVILGGEYDETCDLWSFACMIFELITGDYLFDPKSSDRYSKEEDHIAFITELIGHPEVKWLKKCKRFRKYYTTRGKMKRIYKHKIWKLKDVFIDKYCFKKDEAEKLADFLGLALQWRNEDRASAQEMLKHEWLNMPSDYNYRVESDDGEGEDEDEDTTSKANETPCKTDTSGHPDSDDEWKTLSSEESVYDEGSESSEFELIDHP